MNKIENIVIVHFQPLEKYPPVMNLLTLLSEGVRPNQHIYVLTTATPKGKKQKDWPGITVHRLIDLEKTGNRLTRASRYFRFIVASLRLLKKYRPARILYYETISAVAPILYKKYLNKHAGIFIHYHEYTSPIEYHQGMALNKWAFSLEKRFYSKANWISHTNEERISLFKNDLGKNAPRHIETLPNYPSRSWIRSRLASDQQTGKAAFVYVGALSIDHLYLKEFARFIIANKHHCYWHIFSDNISRDAISFLETLDKDAISFKGSVEYDQLPDLLARYHTGVILYKGHIPNYVYNAPNKLFEYLACGLNVWFPTEMKGVYPYITHDRLPEVRMVDFGDLDGEELKTRSGSYIQPAFFYEEVYQKLVNPLLGLN